MKLPGMLRLICAQVCLHATMAGCRLAAPLLALQQGYSAAAVGLLVALFALSQVFLALPAGRFADRHGLRRPIGLSVTASVLGAGLVVVFPNFAMMGLAALLSGAATGTTVIALQRHVGRAATDSTELRQAFSWLAIAPAAANFVGPFVAGLLIDHAGHTAGDMRAYRVAFLVLALMPLASWLLVRRERELPPVVAPAGGPPLRAWDLLRDAMFRRLLFCNWMQSSAWDVHAFLLPVLGHERGLSASVIGSILGAFAIAAALIRVVLPRLTRNHSERNVITLATCGTAAVFAAYPFLNSPWTMGLCSVLLGFTLGSVQPMVMSLLHQITPHHRHGEALGLRLMAINASSVVIPMVAGSVGAFIGIAGVFWVISGVLGLGVRVVRRLDAAPVPGQSR